MDVVFNYSSHKVRRGTPFTGSVELQIRPAGHWFLRNEGSGRKYH